MSVLTRNIAELRAEVKAHLDMDALRRGVYWSGGKGCFIGCLNHSANPIHAFERFGLTVEIQKIAESIFESIPDEEGRAFFAAMPDAVRVDGKDLSRVHWAFLAAELRALPEVPADVQAVIDPVIAGMDALSAGKQWPAGDADAAYAAATSVYAYAAAVYAADAAAYAAAYAAAGGVAANAHAAAATRAAANAHAAAGAAVYAARIRQRDTLLRLIADAPIAALKGGAE